ncbi:hypothetical protein H5410_026414 [Solanum commersonii]|uniref:Uncharacterized protein n=1 Tax=Solanum commersonii TaxID=4109 RepID=A0A9J5YWZ9_SOLCO|nr:hypothetical protein H5410_026414 [Solanum commersonii]
MTKSDDIIEGDPFTYKGRSTKIGHPYLTPTVRETKQKPYTDEVKDTIIDALKVNLKATDLAAVDEDYTTQIVDKDGVEVDVDEILPLAIVDEDLVAVDEYSVEEVNEQEEEKMLEEKKQEENEEKKTEENKEEEKEEEKIEEKKEEEKEEELIEEKEKEEKEDEQIEEKEKEEKEDEQIEEKKKKKNRRS